jgi:DNA-binding CsgD family transcriptional regulator/ligand-binding sensor protein
VKKELTSQEWLKVVGKERLQAFQDSFSRGYGIGLGFMDTNGKAMTVDSNFPMLCHTMLEHPENKKRCDDESCQTLILEQELKKPQILTCYAGLQYFICPVYFNNQLVAVAHSAGIADADCRLPKEILNKFHTAIMPRKKLEAICELLGNTLELLNIDLKRLDNVLEEQIEATANNNLFDNKLSKREEEVARLICEGMSNKAIAKKLFISEKTVKTHVRNILINLDLKDRMQVVVEYCKNIAE